MKPVHPFCDRPLFWCDAQVVRDKDTPHDEHVVVFFNLSDDVCFEQAFAGRNPARLQRAAKGAGESAGGCRYEVVNGGGMRLVGVRIGAIVLGYFGVESKEHGFAGGREVCPAQWPFDSFYAGS